MMHPTSKIKLKMLVRSLFFNLNFIFVQRHTEIKNEKKLRYYAHEILKGLNYIHTQNVIHSDMKLSNILLNRPSAEEKAKGVLPSVKICDFGISQIIPPGDK